MLFDEGWYLVREVCGCLWDPPLQQFRQHWQLETYYAQVFYTELHNIIFEPSPRFSTMYFVQKPDLFVSFSRFLGRGPGGHIFGHFGTASSFAGGPGFAYTLRANFFNLKKKTYEAFKN